MKKCIALVLALAAGAVWAGCTTQTVISPNGKAMSCTTCCDGNGNCNTTCVGG